MGRSADEEADEESSPERPAPVRRSSSSNGKANGTALAAAGGAVAGGAAAAAAGNKDGESSSDEFDEEASLDDADTSEEEEEDESRKPQVKLAPRPNKVGTEARAPTPRAGKSKAAKIAIAKMEEDIQLRGKLGKPLSQLTAQDVALTPEDIKEDISVVWKAMSVCRSLPFELALTSPSTAGTCSCRRG